MRAIRIVGHTRLAVALHRPRSAGGEQVALISIDEPKDRAKIPAALARLNVSLESWDEADTGTMGRFGLGDIVPGTAILDDKGEVVARIMGEAHEDDVRRPVDWLLGVRAGRAQSPMTKRY
jgi:hypothetical protein